MVKLKERKILYPVKEDWEIQGLREREHLFGIWPHHNQSLNDHDRLLFAGYRFVGIKRCEDDETAQKIRQYRQQGRELASLAVSVILKDEWSRTSEKIVKGVEAYFVR